MAVQFACPGCRSGFRVDDSLCGRTLRCTRCQKVFRIGSRTPRPAPTTTGSGRLVGPAGVLVLGAGLLIVLSAGKDSEHTPPAASRPETTEANEPRQDALVPGTLRRMPPLTEEAPELRAPKIEGDRAERLLPGTITDVAVGGGGRYLLLLLGARRQIVVFDVNEARVTGSIPAPGEVRMAAGLHKLVVGWAGSNVVERWDLATRRREAGRSLALAGPLAELCMGSASHGPLLVTTAEQGGAFFDPDTFAPVVPEHKGAPLPRLPGPLRQVRASADGSVFVAQGGAGPYTLRSFVLAGDRLEVAEKSKVHRGVGVPGDDGRLLYTSGAAFDQRWDMVRKPAPPDRVAGRRDWSYLPGHGGDYYLRMEPGARADGRGKVVFFAGEGAEPVGELGDVAGVLAEEADAGLACDRRAYYFAAAKLLVTVPASADRLRLYRFDVEAALAKARPEVPVVTSRPPRLARRGTTFTYQVAATTGTGRTTFRLGSNPEGMRVSPAGRITWPVPPDLAADEATVMVVIGDGEGHDVFHKFPLSVVR